MGTIFFWFIVALLFALIEVELEGRYGWAEKAQTWYLAPKRLPKIFHFILGKKPLTGYHLFLFPLALLLTHTHFLMGVAWSLEKEFSALALFLVWTPFWDYLWFVFNPNYKFPDFRSSWWYAQSTIVLGLAPLENVIQWFWSFSFAAMASWVVASPGPLISQVVLFATFAVLTVSARYLLVPLYQRWYWKMRRTDDRAVSGISHEN